MNKPFSEIITDSIEADFFSKSWSKSPKLLKKQDVTWCQKIISMPDIHYLISSLGGSEVDWLVLTKEGQKIPENAYIGIDSFVRLKSVLNFYEGGNTLILRKLHKRHSPLARQCRQLEKYLTQKKCLLSKEIGANMYLTPPQSKGFPIHYDSHDVFILQIEGKKDWRIFPQGVDSPLDKFSQYVTEDQMKPAIIETTLEAGDILYIPRGFYHDAVTKDSHSLHITLSVHPLKWLEVLESMARQVPEFRQNMPMLGGDSNELTDWMRENVLKLVTKDRLDRTLEDKKEAFFNCLSTLPQNAENNTHEGNIDRNGIRFKRGEGMFSVILKRGGSFDFIYPGSKITAPLTVLTLFEFINCHSEFSFTELPDIFPPPLKKEFVSMLVKEGFLNILNAS